MPRVRPPSALRDFIHSEAAGGILLFGAAALAMLVANSPLADAYHHALEVPVGPELTPKLGPMTPHLWINDGLMALFFLLVGLEVKREFVDGRLATWSRRRLPFIAAAAGMLVPAVVYLAIAGGRPELTRGWAIPAATDIAFALGVMALLGKRAPASLKLFLTTVAIFDDMGAVLIIALFYTASLQMAALLSASAVAAFMWWLGRRGVTSLLVFFGLFLVLWYLVLLSGVHATIAGVVAAFCIPIRPTPGAPEAVDSPLHRLEHRLHPWVAFAVVPIFGFANAGVSFGALPPYAWTDELTLAIAAGLFIGKQFGILGAVWGAAKLGWVDPPRASWLQIYGTALLCGIGFTMSLFIGELAFFDPMLREEVKLGVIMGSLLSALAGYLVLRFAPLVRYPRLIRTVRARQGALRA